jgi:hypothetical protein
VVIWADLAALLPEIGDMEKRVNANLQALGHSELIKLRVPTNQGYLTLEREPKTNELEKIRLQFREKIRAKAGEHLDVTFEEAELPSESQILKG